MWWTGHIKACANSCYNVCKCLIETVLGRQLSPKLMAWVASAGGRVMTSYKQPSPASLYTVHDGLATNCMLCAAWLTS